MLKKSVSSFLRDSGAPLSTLGFGYVTEITTREFIRSAEERVPEHKLTFSTQSVESGHSLVLTE